MAARQPRGGAAPDRRARRSGAVHRAGARQLLGEPTSSSAPASARPGPGVGALEPRPREPLADRGPAAQRRRARDVPRARARPRRRGDSRRHDPGELPARARGLRGARCSTPPPKPSGPRCWTAPTCCSNTSTACRASTPRSMSRRRRSACARAREEIAAGRLLRRIDAEEPPLPEDHQLAERIGFDLERAARPFVIALPRAFGRAPTSISPLGCGKAARWLPPKAAESSG